MLTFISFGSGSCGNCYYLSTEKSAILIDCGIGIRKLKKSFAEYGVKIPRIHAILITHDHSDHVKAAAYLSNEFCIPVYTTKAIHIGIDNNWNTTKKIDHKNRRFITHDTPFTIDDFNITPFFLPHDASDNTGYSIQAGEEVFTIMTDIGDITENVSKHIRLANHLVIESNYDLDMLRTGPYPEQLKERISNGTGHVSNAQTAQALAQNYHPELKDIYLCHLSEENNHPEIAFKTAEAALNALGRKNGTDYNLIPLKRKLTTGPFAFGL